MRVLTNAQFAHANLKKSEKKKKKMAAQICAFAELMHISFSFHLSLLFHRMVRSPFLIQESFPDDFNFKDKEKIDALVKEV